MRLDGVLADPECARDVAVTHSLREKKRDFTFVLDIVDGIVAALKSNHRGEIFNLGTGAPQSVNRLVSLLGGDSVHIPKRPGEPDVTYADITKAKRELNWEPKTRFEDGVQIMLKNIDLWKGAPVWTPETIEKATKKWFESLK